jgi:hypothetical protein
MLILSLLLPEFVHAQGGRTYSNTSVLTDLDWCEGSGDTWRVISLREGEEWDSGPCWVFSTNPHSFVALKGTYHLYSSAEQPDTLLLRVAFQRAYDGRRDDRDIKWSMRTKFLPLGAMIEIPTDEGDAVPDDNIVLSVVEGFFVDGQGQRIVRYNDPYGIKESIFGAGEKKVRSLPFAYLGESFKTNPSNQLLAQLGFDENPPPGFQVRKGSTRETVFRPNLESKSKKPDLEEIRSRAAAAYNAQRYAECVELATHMLGLDGSQKWALAQRANAYGQLREYRKELADRKQYLELNPGDAWAKNNLAWLLATCPDSSIRNGTLAVQHAKEACELSDYKDATKLDTLAAAYAEMGDFAAAAYWQSTAVSMVPAESSAEYKARLKLYDNNKPYRD